MRALIASAIIAFTTSAQAYCVPVPDNAESGYVANDMQRTLCIQRELAEATAAHNRQVQLNATLSKLQRDALQQRFLLLQQQTTLLSRRLSLLP